MKVDLSSRGPLSSAVSAQSFQMEGQVPDFE